MTITLDSDYDDYNHFVLAPPLNTSDWNGRQITCMDDRSEIERRILEIYNSGNHFLAYHLATLYFRQIHPQYEIQLVKSPKVDIYSSEEAFRKYLEFCESFFELYVAEAKQISSEVGLTEPPPPESLSESNYPAIAAWQTYCLENGTLISESKSGGFKEFWRENKKWIIIAAVVIVVAVAVTVVIVTTQGGGTKAAVATGAEAVKSVIDSLNDSEPVPVHDGIQNFAKSIGATDVNDPGSPIRVIETSSLPEISPETLTGLVTHWNAALAAPTVALGETSSIATSGKALGEIQNSYPPPPTFDLETAQGPVPHPFYPAVDLEGLYGQETIARWYEEFGLQYTSPQPAAPTPQERRPSSQEFVRFIEDKLGETRNIEKYKRDLWERHHDFAAAAQAIETFLERTKPSTPIDTPFNNYASTLALNKPPAPIADIPLLGYPHQSTIHYHCGIGNNYGSVVEGGLCLGTSLDDKFAVQPHLIHSNNVVAGLSLVQVEKFDDLSKEIAASGVPLPASVANSFKWPYTDIPWPETVLQHSHIQSSIDYEVENLSRIAHKIIETGNSNLKQVHVTFSNGGYVFREALKRLTPEERATIIVVTTGTTSIINHDLACVVYNVIGDKDWPSITCNGGIDGIEAAKARANIEMIGQNETKAVLGGHYFIQPEYQDELKTVIKDRISNKYEIY